MLNKEDRENVDVVLEGGIVVTLDEERRIYDPGYIVVDGGSIVDLGSGSSNSYNAKKTIDASGKVILPGIINAHNHLDQSLYRGCFDEKQYSRDSLLIMAKQLTRDRAKKAASLSLLEQVKYGITTTQENHWTHYHIESTDGICEAIDKSNMRAFVSRGMNDVEK